LQIEEITKADINNIPQCNQYFVDIEGEQGSTNHNSSSNIEKEHAMEEERFTENFFELPKVPLPTIRRTTKDGEPYIDYLKSIWKSLEQITMRKEQAA